MIITNNQLSDVRKKHKDQTIVIGLGSFDMYHWEHLQFIKACKKLGDILILAVKSDRHVAKKGNGRPIINQTQRLEIIDSIKYVDYVVLADEEIELKQLRKRYFISSHVQEVEWWKLFYPIFEKLCPDVFCCEISNPPQKSRELYLKSNNIKYVERKYRGIITTSKIRNKILSFK